MKWRKGRKSENVEDRRSTKIPGGAAEGIGGIGLILILLISMFMGVDPSQYLKGMQESTGAAGQQSQLSEEINQSADVVAWICKTEITGPWIAIIAIGNPKLH